MGTGFATEELDDGKTVTLCCDGSDKGRIYEGKLEYTKKVTDLSEIPSTKTHINLNLADPDSVFRWWKLPIDGIGLARMEFTVTEHVKAHPMALAHPEMISDPEVLWQIEELTKRFDTPADYMVDTLARGLACLSAMCYPKPVIVRMSDFKTNEYATLLGGSDFEPDEGMLSPTRFYFAGVQASINRLTDKREGRIVCIYSLIQYLLLFHCNSRPQ